jgi:hypothetical protein
MLDGYANKRRVCFRGESKQATVNKSKLQMIEPPKVARSLCLSFLYHRHKQSFMRGMRGLSFLFSRYSRAGPNFFFQFCDIKRFFKPRTMESAPTPADVNTSHLPNKDHHLPNGQGFKNPWPSWRTVNNTEFAQAWVRQVNHRNGSE